MKVISLVFICLLVGCAKQSFDSGVHYYWFDEETESHVESNFTATWTNQLVELSISNAIPDAIASFESGEYLFVATMGIGAGTPGLIATNSAQGRYYIKLKDLYGYKTISGTSDVRVSDLQQDVCKAAHYYAEAYNRKMLELLEEKGMHSSWTLL